MSEESRDSDIIQIKDLSFYREDRAIFKHLNINIKRGSVTAIMGPSGTGKTTLLRLIGGQLKPHQGSVTVEGLDVAKLKRKKLYQLRENIGMLFQSGALLTDMSVYDNIAFPLREHTNLSEQFIRHLVIMKLNAVGLRGARNLMPAELSGGMQRRVALARAIAMDPGIILYDEPFTGQDPIAMGVLLKLIRTLNDALGMTSVIVSHDVQETAAIADTIHLLSNSKIIASGSPDTMMDNHSEAVDQFMHGLPDGPVSFHFPAPDYREDLLEINQ